MPTRIRFRTAEAGQGFLLLFGGHLRSFAGIETDKDNFVVTPGIEREHSQHADHALFNLIAKHRAAVVDEGKDNGLLPEIHTQLNIAAGFVAESQVQRHLTVERWLESHVSQSRGHGCSRGADAPGRPFSAMIFIASLTGTCAMPEFLSIQPNLSFASVSAFNLSRKSCCGSV